MKQILLAYGVPKETIAAITILYRNAKVKVRSPDGDTILILANTPNQAETLLHSLERAAADIGLHVNELYIDFLHGRDVKIGNR